MDTTPYLRGAWRIHESGGPGRFIPNCLTGTYDQANQHPLYLLLLSPLARRDPSFFVAAKGVSLLAGIVLLLSFFHIVRRLFSLPEAFVAVTLLTVNAHFLKLTTMVACESTLMIFVVWTWYFISLRPATARHSALAGAAAGLAWLTKGSALLFVAGFLVDKAFAFRKERAVALRRTILFGCAFLVVASPLLIRNQRLYGTPFYNVNSHIMWLDSWKDYFRLENEGLLIRRNTARSYFESHSVRDIARRILLALRKEAHTLSALFEPTAGYTVRFFVFPLLFALFLVGIRADAPSRRIFPIATTAIFFLMITWFAPIAGARRYWFPLLPIFLAYAAHGGLTVARRFAPDTARPPRHTKIAAALAGALFLVAVAARDRDFSNPLESYRFKPGYEALIGFMEEKNDLDHMLIGPTHGYSTFYTNLDIRRALCANMLETPDPW